MKSSFLLVLALLTFALGCFQFATLQFLSYEWHPAYLVLYVFFPLITLLIYTVLNKQITNKPQTFVTYFMGSMTAKLLAAMGILLVVLYTQREIKVPFALFFMAFYLAYTALSVVVLFKKLRQQNG